MSVEPLIGEPKYRWQKRWRAYNQHATVTNEGICLFEGYDCIYTVGLHECGLYERMFVSFKTGKGHKSDMFALMGGLKRCLTIEALRSNPDELKLGDGRFYVNSSERELGGVNRLSVKLPFVPEIYSNEGRYCILYLPATRPTVAGG